MKRDLPGKSSVKANKITDFKKRILVETSAAIGQKLVMVLLLLMTQNRDIEKVPEI
jgi:Na+-translocating ferredoxin:NAD+ oxidoreductase RnfA subunit